MGQKNFIEIKVLEISSNPVSINNNLRQKSTENLKYFR